MHSENSLTQLLTSARPELDEPTRQRLQARTEAALQREALPASASREFSPSRPPRRGWSLPGWATPALVGGMALVIMALLFAPPGQDSASQLASKEGGGQTALSPQASPASPGADARQSESAGKAAPSAGAQDSNGALNLPPVNGAAPQASRRQQTFQASISLRVPAKRLLERAAQAERAVIRLGGFVSSSQVIQGPTNPEIPVPLSEEVPQVTEDRPTIVPGQGSVMPPPYGYGGDRGELTFQVPVAQLNQSLSELSRLGKVVSVQSGSQDVTSQQSSAKKQIAELSKLRGRLRAQLRGQLSASERLRVREELKSVQAQIKALGEQRARTGQQVRTSTVRLSLIGERPQPKLAPPPDNRWGPSHAWERIEAAWRWISGSLLLLAGVLLPPALLVGLALWLTRHRRAAKRPGAPYSSPAPAQMPPAPNELREEERSSAPSTQSQSEQPSK